MFSNPRWHAFFCRRASRRELSSAMLSSAEQISNLENLRQYVLEVLCEQNQLELGAFPLSERILVRRGKPCGLFFCLHGPRSVKFTAIWETERNTILFYDGSGERTHRTRLVGVPRLMASAA
jgi:hypothetical protein